MVGIARAMGSGRRDPPGQYSAALERGIGSHRGTVGSTQVDSLVSVANAEASPDLGLFRGASTVSHLLPTQNSRQTHTSELAQLAGLQAEVVSPTRRLSEYKMIVDGCHCPRFRKMKDTGRAVQSQLRRDMLRAR